jgi:hypothetical protein
MISGCATVAEWKEANADNIIECRWGCRLSRNACTGYQTKSKRYIAHFQGEKDPLLRINSDFLICAFPDPCPYFLSDEEAEILRDRARQLGDDDLAAKRAHYSMAKQKDRLVNPNIMLSEADWVRSLIKL